MPTYAIAEVAPGCPIGFEARGGARELWTYRGHECILAGPSETGKTYACLQKLDALLWKYAGATAVIVRKTLTSLHTTALRTYKNVLRSGLAAGEDSPVKFFGGEKPEWADYPNGSRVYFAGMDNPQKALSSERDFIYVNQAEELTLNDWETLTTRCTGRAGVAPHPQIFGDCNPGPPSHWIKHRSSLKLFESRHEDNPTLFDDEGKVTAQGIRTLAVLDNLTGVRKDRLRHGKWVQAEGVVYEEFDRNIHLVDPARVPFAARRHVAGVDWGWTNPGVIGVFAVDGDKRMRLVREVYRTRRLIGWWVDAAKDLHKQFRIEAFACDPAEPAYIREFQAAGLPAVAGYNEIRPGIQAVKARLQVQPDGRPRLEIAEGFLAERDEELDAVRLPCSTLDEMDVYAYPKGQDGRPIKELPVDAFNHGADQLRYAVALVDGLGPKSGTATYGPSPTRGYRGGGGR